MGTAKTRTRTDIACTGVKNIGVALEASNGAFTKMWAGSKDQSYSLPPTGMLHIRQARVILPSGKREYQSASQKLFADAEKDEHDETYQRDLKERLEQRLVREQNWTGDEKMEDTVLRMLVDKYKPLRGSMRTSEMKLKANPPQITMRTPESQPSTAMQAEDVIIPGIEGHKPWMTTYTTPSFAVNPSIRAMRLSLQAANKRSKVDDTVQVKGPTREERLRIAEANRLASVRERMLDYRFGGSQTANTQSSSEKVKANPKSMKGWASLAEERIHDARMKGAFDNLKGFGKPLQKDVAAENPFISAEDYLLNAYVQRNGATPPWVQLQQELDSSVKTFREILQNAWIRRATRNLSASYNYDPVYLSSLTAEKLSQTRDSEWENKERAYHEHAVAELNSQVRRYNGLAPYSARRGLHTVEGELARCYANSGRHILDALKADPKSTVPRNSKTYNSELGGQLNEMPTLWSQLVQAMRSLFRL